MIASLLRQTLSARVRIACTSARCKSTVRRWIASPSLNGPTMRAFEQEIVGNDEWLGRVLRYRRNAQGHNLRVVISPRASIKGARMLAAGFDQEEVETMLIFKGCDAATIAKIKGE
jgi:hypothetical protein